MVSFIIIPARKGFQAAAVTITDVSKDGEADKEDEAPLEQAMEEMHVGEAEENTTDTTAAADWGSGAADWGSGGW